MQANCKKTPTNPNRNIWKKKAQSHHTRQNDNQKLHSVILDKIPNADVALMVIEELLLLGLIV